MQIRKTRRNQLVSLIGKRAENLFVTKQLMCSEAIMAVLNKSLKSGLSSEMAIRLGSGLCHGIGGSGCACGALTGSVMAMSLFLGRSTPGFGNGQSIRMISRKFHDKFKARFGATCCRVLTKNLKNGSKEHFNVCSQYTGWAAATAAEIILEKNPGLIMSADLSYLKQKDSALKAG